MIQRRTYAIQQSYFLNDHWLKSKHSDLLWTVINSTDIGKLQLKCYASITSAKTVNDVYLSFLSWEQLTFENVEDVCITCVSSPPGVYKIFPSEPIPLHISILLGNHKKVKEFLCRFCSVAKICVVIPEKKKGRSSRPWKPFCKSTFLHGSWFCLLNNTHSDLGKSRGLGTNLQEK